MLVISIYGQGACILAVTSLSWLGSLHIAAMLPTFACRSGFGCDTHANAKSVPNYNTIEQKNLTLAGL